MTLKGLRLGRAADLLVDVAQLRAVGIEVRCPDGVPRFLPFPAARIRENAIEIGSALVLLEDDRFYRERGRNLASLRGSPVIHGRTNVRALSDVVVGSDGDILELIVDDGAAPVSVAVAADVRLVARRRAA